ncbi:MAG: tripartite tricarboxylate transporter TctB family protein [Gammaproteobacteria bacterium]|nr:tripartite tricarboxylate transporter TctB family protein [Gammaproteobacteria bacterium]
MKISDTIFGLIFLALGTSVLLAIKGFPNIPGQPVGPALFPGLIATGLCITGVMLMIKGLLRHKTSNAWFTWEDWVHSPRHVLALCTLLASVVFYIVFANSLGFLPTSFLMLVALFKVLQMGWRRALMVALMASLVVHFAFYKLLRVPLPWGVLTPWAW